MRKIKNLADNWYFTTKHYKKPPKKASDDFDEVTIPHSYKCENAVWYFKDYKPIFNKGERLFLYFDGVAGNTTVYINSKECAYHSSSFTSFSVDITDYIKHKKANIALCVEPSNTATNGYYGVFRPVKLITVPNEHFDIDFYASSGISVKSIVNDDGSADVSVETFISGNISDCNVVFNFGGKRQICSAKNPVVSYHIGSPHLWNGVKDPFLYSITASLVVDNQVIDSVTTKFGIRSYFVDENKGFFLNHKPYPLFGVSISPFENGRNTISAIGSDMMNIVEKAIETGCNAIRMAQNIGLKALFELCDENGIILMPEMEVPSDEVKRDNLLYEVRENVYQQFNHPSLCFWSFYANDDSDTTYKLIDSADALCRMLDSSRLTVLTEPVELLENARLHGITNLVACIFKDNDNDFTNHLDMIYKMSDSTTIGIASFGCEGSEKYHSVIPVGGDMTEEYQSLYYEMLLSNLELRPYIWCSFASGLIGKNGIFSSDFYKKDSGYIMQAYLTDEPFVHICSSKFEKRMTKKITVKIYSNRKEVGLSINDKELGTLTGNSVFVFNNVNLEDGENTLRAFADDCVDDYVVFTAVEDDFNEYSVNGSTGAIPIL